MNSGLGEVRRGLGVRAWPRLSPSARGVKLLVWSALLPFLALLPLWGCWEGGPSSTPAWSSGSTLKQLLVARPQGPPPAPSTSRNRPALPGCRPVPALGEGSLEEGLPSGHLAPARAGCVLGQAATTLCAPELSNQKELSRFEERNLY